MPKRSAGIFLIPVPTADRYLPDDRDAGRSPPRRT